MAFAHSGVAHAEDLLATKTIANSYTRSPRVYVKNLRQMLEPDHNWPRYLVTETGLGYRSWMEEVPLPC